MDDFTMPDRTEVSNTLHWVMDPLDWETVNVLDRISHGIQSFHANPFEVAYLISRECVVADLDRRTLRITEKGKDGLAHFMRQRDRGYR